jgi:hypothetical protein
MLSQAESFVNGTLSDDHQAGPWSGSTGWRGTTETGLAVELGTATLALGPGRLSSRAAQEHL